MIAIVSRSYYDFLNYIREHAKDVTIQNYQDKYVNVNELEDMKGFKFEKAIILYSAIRLHDYNDIIDELNNQNALIEDFIE